MTDWILLGGCLLGLLGVERAQRIWFPGETPLWGWWRGRTRRQEQLTGGGSASRITPQFDFDPDRVLPKYSHFIRQFEERSPMEAEELLRKAYFETRDRYQRILLNGLLAQASVLLENREEAHALIEEAEESLRSNWSNLDPTFMAIAERTLQIKALVYLQEGNTPIVEDILSEVERLFGSPRWVPLLRAEALLMSGRLTECQSLVEDMLDQHPKGPGAPAAWVLLGEVSLRAGDLENMSRAIKGFGSVENVSIEDRAAFLRLKAESALHSGSVQQARSILAELQAIVKKRKRHRGLARAFHLVSSRVQFYSDNPTEALRLLQLAENDSRYPAAHWEVDFFRAFLLESIDRDEEAITIWSRLAISAVGTYFGNVAQLRLADTPKQTPDQFEPSLNLEIAT